MDTAVVLVVDSWAGTFQVPVGAEHRLDPGPRSLVPVGAVLGLLLATAVVQGGGTPRVAWLASLPAFLAGVAGMGLTVGGSRRFVVAMAVAAVAWAPLASAVLGSDRLDHRVATALLALGSAGSVVAGERLRARVLRDRASVLAARDGARSDGWVVGVHGPAWARELRVEPSDGSSGPWNATHEGWLAVPPAVGQAVGIWRGHGHQPVVLVPRTPR